MLARRSPPLEPDRCLPRRRRRAADLVALFAVLSLVLAACSGGGSDATALPVSADTVKALDLVHGWNWQPQPGRLELGVTHTQNSLDGTEPGAARARGEQILTGSGVWQNQHLMGFGTLNPEPAPGDSQWTSLDKRMQLIKNSGARTVFTLCCAPDWMKGGAPGQTDWSQLEVAPDRAHFDDFAELAAKSVARYPQIERVLVWNELKGFYNTGANRWAYEDYTDLYNKVYRAVKAVRPDVQIGGPYISIISLVPDSTNASNAVMGTWGAADRRALDVVSYWLKNNVGADFVAVDGPTQARDGGLPESVEVGAAKFADITSWVRSQTSLPVWWAEFYADVPEGVTAGPSAPASAVSTLAAVEAFARSGVAVALLWGPQANSSVQYSALWTDSTDPSGGQPTPLTQAWQWLVPRLAAGQVTIGRSTTAPLLAFRSADGAVVVNLTGQAVPVADHDPLPPWAVVFRGNDA